LVRLERCNTAKGGSCKWPVARAQAANIKCLGILQRNVGRRITDGELNFLTHSEVWHELRYRVIRGQTIALPWGYVDEGPVDGPGLELMIAEGLAPYHAKRPEVENVTPPPPKPSTPLEERVAAAKAAKRRHRGAFYGV